MKKIQRTKPVKSSDELRSEYSFDYGKSKPNRFVRRASKNCTVVVLDADVSKVFVTSESVNTALRALLVAIPTKAR